MNNFDTILACAKDGNFSAFNSDEWCELLSVHPQYSVHCDWEKFSLQNWVELIIAQVQFAAIFDRWDELNSTQIRKLLILYPSLITKVDVCKIHSLDLVYLLEVHPHFAGIKEINDNMTVDVWHNVIQEGHTEAAIYRKDWENICDDKLLVILKTPEIARQCNTGFWIQALRYYDEFQDVCPCWDKFTAEQWQDLLILNSAFAEKCPVLSEITIDNWVMILRCNSCNIKNFTRWNELELDQWYELLNCYSCSDFYPYCNCWDKISDTKSWAKRISHEPSCANECDLWEDFSCDDWILILREQPQFAHRCDKWEDFSCNDWSFLLSRQVHFAERDELTFEKIGSFDELDWSRLRSVINKFEKIRAEFGEEIDWAQLLVICPDYLENFNKWPTFSANDWSTVLRKYPELAEKCDKWGEFSSSDWAILLRYQIRFFDKCDKWDEFSSDDWESLLKAHPGMQKMKPEKIATSKEITQEQDFCKSQECLTVEQWVDLLCKDDNAAKECPVLDQIPPDGWVRIFQKNAPLAQRFCPQSCYDSLTDEQSEIVNQAICGLIPRKKKKQSVPAEQPRRAVIQQKADILIPAEEECVPPMLEASNISKNETDLNSIPYDPPWLPDISSLFEFSFTSLTEMPEKLQEKYSIKDIKSLCGFDLENAQPEDRDEICKLQNKWQPGNWLLSNLSCSVLFIEHDRNNIIKLKNAGIRTIGDFISFQDFRTTTLSEKNAKKCRLFQRECREVGMEEFIAKQRAYREKLWEKKLAEFPMENVAEPNYEFCRFPCSPLNSFVLEKNVTDPEKNELQWEYRSIYPDWEKLNFTPDNFLENIGNKKKIGNIFLENYIITLEDFLNYSFDAHDLKETTKKGIKNIQQNIFPRAVEEPPVDIESKIAELKDASGIKDALKIILGNDSANADYLDNYIAKIIEGKTLETVAESTGKTKERIRQQVKEITKKLNDVAWWDAFCEEFFTKFGRISAISAVEAKGNELLGNHLGSVIAECLKKSYKKSRENVLICADIHTQDNLEILNETLSSELLTNGKASVSKDEFMDICRDPLEKYFGDLALDTEYISNESLWDILKPAGRNADGGKTVILMSPGGFIRQNHILNSEPMLRDDITKAMRKAGYTGCIPENNFADRLQLAVYSQEGLQYKYMLQEDLPQLEDDLLTEIVDSIKDKLRNAYCVNLEQICEDFSNRLHNITPFMLKAILKKKNALEDVIYDNTSTQVWRNSEIIGLQQILEQKLQEAGSKVPSIEFRLLAQRKGYHENARANAVNSSEKILTGGEGEALYYLHADLLDLDMEKFQQIFSMIENEIVISAEKLFNSHRELCKESGVEDARLLASILKKCSPYYVDYPVVSCNEESAITLRDMGIEFIKTANWKSKEEIDAFYAEKHYNSQWFVLQKHPDIFLIAENYVAHRENIGWKDEYGEKLLALANEALNESGKKYMKTGKFVYDLTMGAKKECLPVLKNTNWSQALIISLLDKSEEFAAAGCNNSVFFRKEESLQNFEDLCCLIKKEENPPDIVRYLSEKGMISDSWKYDPANQEFIKKLLEN